MHYMYCGFGRIEGNNDIFYSRKRDFSPANKTIFSELVDDAKNGLFDNAFSAYDEAFSQVDLNS